MWGLDPTPLEGEAPPEEDLAETTQQKAIRLSREARDRAVPGPVAPQTADPEEKEAALKDTQAAALPDPMAHSRLKQKLRVMLQRKG